MPVFFKSLAARLRGGVAVQHCATGPGHKGSMPAVCRTVSPLHEIELKVGVLIGCVVPKMHWLYMISPSRMLQRVTDAHQVGKRVLVALRHRLLG